MIDVDHFKLFNDTRGHVEGDNCLRMLGTALTLIASNECGLAGRYGGEEFVVLLPNAVLEKATAVAERIRIAVEKLYIRHDATPSGHVTVSIGVASLVPRDTAGAEGLVHAADASVYVAKRRGRNTVVAQAPAELLAAS